MSKWPSWLPTRKPERTTGSDHHKVAGASEARLAIEAVIGRNLKTEPDFDVSAANDNVLDAVLCVIAGLDFVGGAASRPSDRDTAEREGWIWVRERGSDG